MEFSHGATTLKGGTNTQFAMIGKMGPDGF
jgi:hypothetical protein